MPTTETVAPATEMVATTHSGYCDAGYLGGGGKATLADCKAACTDSADCTHYSYDGSYCMYYSGECASTVTTTAAEQAYTTYQYARPGWCNAGYLGEGSEAAVDDCRALCASNLECVYYSSNGAGEYCMYYSSACTATVDTTAGQEAYRTFSLQRPKYGAPLNATDKRVNSKMFCQQNFHISVNKR